MTLPPPPTELEIETILNRLKAQEVDEAPLRTSSARLILTPMIDIVFQLIAFFIFALSFETLKVQPDIKPPPWSDPVPKSAAEQEELIFEIDGQGQFLAGENWLPIESPEGKSRFEESLQSATPATRIVLRADQHVPFEVVKACLALCRSRQPQSVQLRLRKPSP